MSDNGEELARAWLQGKSELLDSLADLVEGMDRPLGEMERAFLQTIGNAARAEAKREGKPTSLASDPASALRSAPSAEFKIDIEEFRRRQREHERRAQYEELAANNASIPIGSMPRDEGWGRF
jgi:hypothetical protein